MDANERIEKRHVVVDTPGVRREVVTETSRGKSEESSISGATIALIALLAVVAIGIVVYIVSNKNANEAANREAAAQIAAQDAAAQQPQAQQSPIIIQQPAPAQQQPIIVQQPVAVAVPESGTTIDDSSMFELATKRLAEDPGFVLVVPTITNGRAVLTGSVNTAADKLRAETVVKAVRGVKSVDNRISVSNP